MGRSVLEMKGWIFTTQTEPSYETKRLIQKLFGVRDCTDAKFNRHKDNLVNKCLK